MRVGTSSAELRRIYPNWTVADTNGRDALERLEAHRPELVAPLVLRDLSQLSYEEIAEHLAVPVGTCKSRIHDARRHVRASLAGSVVEH